MPISETAKKITQAQAHNLALNGQPAFAWLSAYLTYTDVAAANSISGLTIQVNDTINSNTGLIEYVVADGTYPIRKDRKMFPR